jgi:hypothetical protein
MRTKKLKQAGPTDLLDEYQAELCRCVAKIVAYRRVGKLSQARDWQERLKYLMEEMLDADDRGQPLPPIPTKIPI